MRVIGPESLIHNEEVQPSQIVPEVSGNTSVVDLHVGADRNANVTGLDIATTGAINTGTPEEPESTDRAFPASKGFRKRWADRKSEGSERSDPLVTPLTQLLC